MKAFWPSSKIANIIKKLKVKNKERKRTRAEKASIIEARQRLGKKGKDFKSSKKIAVPIAALCLMPKRIASKIRIA